MPIEESNYYITPYVYIDGNVASSKNGKIWTGSFLVNSKQTQAYIKESKPDYIYNKDKFLKFLDGKTKPYHVSFLFVRKSRHKFDYVNPLQMVLDLMVKYGYIEDDNMTEIIPYFEEYEYDKDNAGCFITVLTDSQGNRIQSILREIPEEHKNYGRISEAERISSNNSDSCGSNDLGGLFSSNN